MTKPKSKKKSDWIWDVIWGISGKWYNLEKDQNKKPNFQKVGIIPPDEFRWSEYNAFFVTMMLGRIGVPAGNGDIRPDILHIAEKFSYQTEMMKASARYAHYLALYHAVPKRKRRMIKLGKKSKEWSDEHIRCVADMFQLNDDRAIEYLEDMGKDQGDLIVQYYKEIGR